MKPMLLWLRWSWRDLRLRWLQVLAIALIIALGSGSYSGLISTSAWRLQSNDASYDLLNMYDLRLTFTEGSYLEGNELVQAANSIDHAGWLTAVEPRLILPTLVDASIEASADRGGDRRTIMVPGQLIGAGVPGEGGHVNDVYISAGRAIEASEAGQLVAVLEYKFARYYELPPQGEIRVSGDKRLRYVGTGLSPEYFFIMPEEGGMMAEANFAALFVPLETAQALAGQPGLVNDLLIRLAPGADQETVQAELTAAVENVADVGLSFMLPDDDRVYRMMYEDIDSDELFWRWMAYLFLAGAVFGAFNLAARLVEAQRREIGIQMALGVDPGRIAIRPLLVAVQIAILGVLLGMAAGLWIGRAFGDVVQDMAPMPVFVTPFQSRIYLEAAALGILLPLLATLLPVLRALRVEPVEAIRTGHLVAKGGGLAPLLSRRSIKGRVLRHMPVRNLLSAPRRALLTILGLAAAVALLVLVMGALDSFDATLDAARSELFQDNDQRIVVQLDSFYPAGSAVFSGINGSSAVGAADPSLKLAGSISHDEASLEVVLDLVDMESTVWRPTVIRGGYPEEGPGLLIAASAARELGVEPGDTITLRHPQRTGLFSYDWIETEVAVSGIHALALRYHAYMDLRQAGLMGLDGLANIFQVIPAPGVRQDQVKQALFSQPGVASVQPVSAVIRVYEELIAEFEGMFRVMQVGAVMLALLVAYNYASINLDERAREMATMFAFGVRVRSAMGVTVVENLLTSLAGTAVGCGLGALLLRFMLRSVFVETTPDIDITIVVHPLTLVAAVVMAVMVAILTPPLNIRKLTTMDIPSTLRVME